MRDENSSPRAFVTKIHNGREPLGVSSHHRPLDLPKIVLHLVEKPDSFCGENFPRREVPDKMSWTQKWAAICVFRALNTCLIATSLNHCP